MKVVLAPASFKGFLLARQAAWAMRQGIRPLGAKTLLCPMADGGEGTLGCLYQGLGGRFHVLDVKNPIGRPIRARLLWQPRQRRAVIEMAQAAGWRSVRWKERDVALASTYGVGQLVRASLEFRPKQIVVTLGGSVTHDGGTGLLRALGVRFLDSSGCEVPEGCLGLERLHAIDTQGLDPRLADVSLAFAADVTIPLLGPDGATLLFAKQKGARLEDLPRYEAAMANFAEVCERSLGSQIDRPLAGAGGGTGAGLMLLGASAYRGAPWVASAIRLEERLNGADLVITGEGRLDRQSLQGKAPFYTIGLAQRLGVPAAIVVANISDGITPKTVGAEIIFFPRGMSAAEGRQRIRDNLARSAAWVVSRRLPSESPARSSSKSAVAAAAHTERRTV